MSRENAHGGLRQQVFALVSEVMGDRFDSNNVDDNNFDASAEFTETGMSSVEYLELIDKIETNFDVFIDLESNIASLTSVDAFVDLLLEQRKSA